MILMKYHALFVSFERALKFEIAVCCKLSVALYGLIGALMKKKKKQTIQEEYYI